MAIDLTPLSNAIAALTRALDRHGRDPSDEEVRDSVIQRFEFTYDLSHKMLRRVLAEVMADADDVSLMTFSQLIRTGWELGLLRGSWPTWEKIRELRNITSHTYDRDKAISVASQVPDFLEEARELERRLRDRLAT